MEGKSRKDIGDFISGWEMRKKLNLGKDNGKLRRMSFVSTSVFHWRELNRELK